MPGERGKRNQRIRIRVTWLTAALVFLADLALKNYLRVNYAGESIPLVPNILHCTVVFNTGAAFGILQGKTTALAYTTIFFIILFLNFIKREGKGHLLFTIACGLIIGGALSNLFDRLVFGFVIDYIDIRVWPVFNLSDSCISVGAALLFLDSFRSKKPGSTKP
ncbi:MAG: signal peptidase II [Candidatus Omnitrophota bacterium]|nr:signal peptidase II [Candidatus Omnitrophota bacterium]